MPGNDLQIDWLRAFVAVVDAGSLSAAAPLVHRSQSAVSMQLQKLEQAVGGTVLHRGPRHLSLTPLGVDLLTHARRLLAVHGEAVAALTGKTLTGLVRMGVPDDYAAAYLTPVLRSYAARHSAVEIMLDCEQSTALIPRVQSGELDLALVSRDHARRGQLLFHEPLVWVGSPHFEVWRQTPLPIAVYESTSLARRNTLAALRTVQRPYRVVYNSSSLPGQIAAVESGLAIAVLTRCCAPAHLQLLGERHGLPELGSMEVALYRSATSRGNPAVDALFELAQQTLLRPT